MQAKSINARIDRFCRAWGFFTRDCCRAAVLSVLIKQDAALGGIESRASWQDCVEAMLALRVAGGALGRMSGQCSALGSKSFAL